MRLASTMVAIVVCGLGTVAAADTIRVPADHQTIQAAVNAATDGDVIEISKGKYAEDVTVTGRSNLTIVGKGSVTLQPTVTGLTADGCSDLVVQKIKVQGGRNGFDFQDCDGVLLERFSVKDVSFDGVHAAGGSDIRIVKGKISNCDHDGVAFVAGEPGRSVAGGEVTQVKVKECDEDGIDINGTDVTVTSCSVKNADDDGFESSSDTAGPVTFERCKAKNSGDEGFELFGDRSIVLDCKSQKSVGDGFDFEGDDSRGERCTSKKARASGIEIESARNVTLIDCKSIASAENGIAVFESNDCLIDGCKAIKSGDNGFFLDNNTFDITLRNNKASKSSDEDLDDESGGANDIDDSNKFKTVDANNT